MGWSFGFLIPVMYIRSACRFMVMNGLSFCEKIGQVLNAGSREHFELSSSDDIMDPVISYRSGLESADPNGFVRSLGRCTVISPDLCFHLGETKVSEDILEDARPSCCHEEGCIFGFSGRG